MNGRTAAWIGRRGFTNGLWRLVERGEARKIRRSKMVRDREKWMFRVKSVLKVLDLSIDENEVVCTVGQAAEALDALGPIVSLLIAFQSQQEARNWIDKVVGVAALRSNYLEEIQRH